MPSTEMIENANNFRKMFGSGANPRWTDEMVAGYWTDTVKDHLPVIIRLIQEAERDLLGDSLKSELIASVIEKELLL